MNVPESRLPERARLEASFIRARWLAAAAIALLSYIGGLDLAAIAAVLATILVGNAVIWRINDRTVTLSAQRKLGVFAVALDAAVVLTLGAVADDAPAITAYAALVIVVAEVSMRFAPRKSFAAALALIAGLAVAMAVDSAMGDDFDIGLFVVLAVLVLLVGTMVGSAAREIYRSGVATDEHSQGTAPELPEDAKELLTPRERQVLTLITQGRSNLQIALLLVVEQKTVKNHINSIYSKLQLNSRYEAITQSLGQRGADAQELPRA
jgi:DNA-binding NarL/FixJ family response regulator